MVFPARGKHFSVGTVFDVPISWLGSVLSIHERTIKPIKGLDIRQVRNAHSISRAQRDAKYLSHKLGEKCDFKWTVIWEADTAFVHRPHPKQRPRPGFAYNHQILGRQEAFEALKG